MSSESFKTTDLSCVKLVTAGGSALSPAAREHVMKEFEVHQKKMSPNMPIVGMAYGTTEIGYPMFRMSFSTNNELCSKSVGTYPRTRDFDVQVRHLEEERHCQNGEPGNIFLLCPLRIRNYWHTRDQLPFQWVQKIISNFYTHLNLDRYWRHWISRQGQKPFPYRTVERYDYTEECKEN